MGDICYLAPSMIKQFLFILVFSLCWTSSWSQTFNGGGGQIPDNGTVVTFPISVSGLSGGLSPAYGLKTVCVDITHPYDADLKAALITPSGQVINLFQQVGGADDNFTNTCFEATAATGIAFGTAPFTGTFKPMGSFGNINNGQTGNGNWYLQMQDVGPADTGWVNFWSITFDTNAPAPLQIATDIPLVVINTNGNGISWTKSPVDLKIIDNGVGNLNYPANAGNVFQGKAGIKRRGAFSSSLPQAPYTFTTYSGNGADSNLSLLGMPSEHDWILLANYNDKSFVRNPLMYHIFRDMGHYAARSRFVEVVVDGEYQGIYSLMEKIKRDDNRVDISQMDALDLAGDSLTGGYIIKHDYADIGWNSQYIAQPCNVAYQFNYEYPNANNIQTQQGNYIKAEFDTLEARLFGTQVYDSIYGYRPLIHLNSFIDYMLANEMSWNGDGYKKSMYFFKKRDSKDSSLHAGPIWDFDWALKRMPWTPADYSGWYYEAAPCDGDVLYLPWWNIMMQDTFFRNNAKCRWEFHRKYALHLDSINDYIDKQALYLQVAQQRHYDYWQTLGVNVGTPESAPFAATYQEEIDTLKSIIKQRILWIDANLPGICTTPIFPNGWEEQSEVQNKVYPNPGRTEAFVESKHPIEKIQLFDINGKEVYLPYEPINPMKYRLQISHLAPGIYTLRLQGANQVEVVKYIKSN